MRFMPSSIGPCVCATVQCDEAPACEDDGRDAFYDSCDRFNESSNQLRFHAILYRPFVSIVDPSMSGDRIRLIRCN